MEVRCHGSWFLISSLYLASCEVAPAITAVIPTPVLVEAIPPSVTPTSTMTMTPSPTQTATVTPTAIPTWEPKLVCEEIIGMLGQLAFPEGKEESGLGADPRGQGDELCWWRVTWAATPSAEGMGPPLPDWPDFQLVVAQALGPGQADSTSQFWNACGNGGSVQGQEIDRGDLVCTLERGSGYPPDDPDIGYTYLSRQVACRYPSPTPSPSSTITPTPPPTARAR